MIFWELFEVSVLINAGFKRDPDETLADFWSPLVSREGPETIVPPVLISAINDFIISSTSLLSIHPFCRPLQILYFVHPCSFQASVIVFLNCMYRPNNLNSDVFNSSKPLALLCR